MPLQFHLLANAHLDPVWLWDWREGLNEGLTTCRTILALMDENPEMTFMRGETAIYAHIEQHDPETFARIAAYVAAGRWEIVGGTFVQPDTNLTSTEALTRHFVRGQEYFESRFGRRARIAWAADSFGHSAGLPEILTAAGLEGFAFTRPSPGEFSPAGPAFWWQGPSGAKVLAYRPPSGWYGTERGEMRSRLDGSLWAAQQGGLQTVGVFYGVGNHGGGPTRRHLAEIRDWAAAHPEVEVIHSSMGRLFDALREDGLPTHEGEMNFCLRGCYASAAKIKYAYRKTESAVLRAETTGAALSAGLGEAAPELHHAWEAVLFNSFHDILPGSSIERALDEQIAWMGGARQECSKAELLSLNALARQVDTQVPPVDGDAPSAVAFLVWNPHPYHYTGPVELEAALDYRPLWDYQGRSDEVTLAFRGPNGDALPFQVIETENDFMRGLPWRKRVVTTLELPPLGWSVVTLGWVEGAKPQTRETKVSASEGCIANGLFRVEAQADDAGVRILCGDQPIFTGAGLSFVTVEDPWGAWGSMDEDPASLDLSIVRHLWQVTQIQMVEHGPERASLWVRLTGGSSRLDLTFSLSEGRNAVDVAARLFWNERGARLKMALPLRNDGEGPDTEFDVPGASVTRRPCGEEPGGRWARASGPAGRVGLATDALYGFDAKDGQLRATIVRASPYASDRISDGTDELWRPVIDSGELRFRFLLTLDAEGSGLESLRQLARELEMPPVTLPVPPATGPLPRTGSLGSLGPASLELLALKPAEDGQGWILRVRETAGTTADAVFEWQRAVLALGPVSAFQITSWRLSRNGTSWTAMRVSSVEKPRVP